MFHACAARFNNVTENIKKFYKNFGSKQSLYIRICGLAYLYIASLCR